MSEGTRPPGGARGEPLLRVGQLAERAGVSPDTIRHYERLGLIGTSDRTAGGYRVFQPAALERVQLIRNAVRAGFSLRQLAAFLSERQAGGAPCHKVRAVAERILAGVDDRIAELVTSRDALRDMLRDWDQRLARTEAGQPARLLDTLDLAPRSSGPGVRRSGL